jgi:AcrR family transcriptional regulator
MLTTEPPTDGSSRSRVLEGAIECFATIGLRRTTMEDVACAAGLTRKTVYNLFGSKAGLVSEVVALEFRRVLLAASDMIDVTLPPDQLIATAEVLILESGKSSPFVAFTLGPDAVGETLDVSAESEQFASLLNEYWEPVLDNIQARGRLRNDVSRELIMRWILSTHLMLISRPETLAGDAKATAEMVRLFLAPAVLTPG